MPMDRRTPISRHRLPKATLVEVEHPLRAIKCQLGFTKVRYKGLANNPAQLMTLFALSNV